MFVTNQQKVILTLINVYCEDMIDHAACTMHCGTEIACLVHTHKALIATCCFCLQLSDKATYECKLLCAYRYT